MLTTGNWLYGISELATVFLSLVAGYIALSMLHKSHKHGSLRAWRFLIIVLVLFAVEACVGALKIFGIWGTPWLTHVIPSFILVFLIVALTLQININKGWFE